MKRSKKEVTPNWHPNFRLSEDLPDIKPIRTGFLINMIAVSICLVLAYLMIQQELNRLNLSNEISGLESTVQETSSANQAALRQSAEFVREAEKLKDISEFYHAPVIAYDFLLELASVRPEGLIYDSISFREIETIERRRAVTSYQLSISGMTKDLIRLDEFKAALSGLSAIRFYNGQVNETILPPDETTGIFPYTINVGLTPPEN